METNSLAKRPDDLTAQRMNAQTLSLAGRGREALRAVRAALEMAPTDEKTHKLYLSVAVDMRDLVAAMEPVRRAVAANPWSPVFHETFAFFLVENREWASALRESREALRLNPFLHFARMFAIQSLLHQNEPALAQEEFATLIKLFPLQGHSLQAWFDEQRREK